MSEPLELDVLLIIEALASGDFLAWPFASPEHVAHGASREAVLELQELFLREHLARLDGAALARFDPHGDVQLHRIEVELARDDLPERLRLRTPLPFPCALVPDIDGAWVVVLNLRHVLWVAEGEELEARVQAEIQRVLAASELDGRAFLELLRGADPFELARLHLEVDREERRGAEARAAARRRHARERSEAEARQLLSSVGASMLEEARRRRAPPVLHREREIAALDALLRGPERMALMLVGPDLAGKSAVIHGLIQRWLERPRGERRALPELVATSGAQLVAGQSGFGQLEQRVHDVMAAAELLDAVLVFDNLSDLFARTSGELGDVAASMRPWIERGRIRILGEISPDLLEHHEKRHVGFFALLNRVEVAELSAEQTREVLDARARFDARYEPGRPTLSRISGHDALTPLVDLAQRYMSYRAFPGKALRFYLSLRATQEGELDARGKPRAIGPEDVYRGFSIHSGIPMFLLREDRRLEHARVVEYFRARVIGQREAIDRVAETLCTVKAGLQPTAKPLATFLFIGPTGVGKTEVAKTLARFLFGSPERMTRFDMSEYMDPLAAERLIRGSDRDDGVLTRKVRQQPFCVLLLDEIEKAHPAVFDLLLQVCGEGRLSDARGRTTWFHNAIIIMTSNLGAAHHRPRSGFDSAPRPSAEDGLDEQALRERERYYLEQVDQHFRPEFVNRLDRVIPFHPLDRQQIHEVAEVSLARVREREGVAERGVELLVSPATLERLAHDGYSDAYGARALRRALEDRLVAPVSRALAALGERGEGCTVVVDEAAGDSANGTSAAKPGERLPPGLRPLAREQHDGLVIEIGAAQGKATRRTLEDLERVSALRRSAQAALELPPLRELAERLRTLVAELGHGAHQRRAERSAWEHSAELTRLQTEHGRIAGTVERLTELRESIESAEELTIAALYEGEPAGVFLDAAEEAHAALRLAIVDALLLEHERHAVIVHLQEQDRRGALCPYLLPLLDELDARGWALRFHVAGDAPEPGDDARARRWPSDRAWGPPRGGPWIRRALLEDLDGHRKRRWRDLLMCVEGRHAGAILRAQLGLFRYESRWLPEARRDDEGRPGHLVIRLISDAAEIQPEAWAGDHLKIPKPQRRADLDSQRKRAYFDERGLLQGSIASAPMAVEPEQFWSRIEEVLFAPLAERAYHGPEGSS
ncbi:ATP-dependent Clp protease ATP-binding subunit [Pseudenhygromyxa sp. WMMC2535]|uniref:AAA family ATPase n=1 Tax=Pseudenhygromyxa sp. WMMC2535 TaxID=2712867 RepID=UPI001557D06F|nr:AAA family ATPase [Pseudenhygromyxa sp. WMMC2535]NVB42884.1 ATP-dependent Clp protease ATP-binding subunit [Pseudenhygromyxa sp. WMMC2535]